MHRRDFFNEDSPNVAKKLIGCRLVYQGQSAIISETEAYAGSDDPASHAYSGMTKRNALMFDQPGHAYIYLIYGMHLCFNVTTSPKGTPGSVFIRAVTIKQKNIDGPGKLTKALGITMDDYGKDLCQHPDFMIDQGIDVSDDQITQSPRIGITKGLDKQWRFSINNK